MIDKNDLFNLFPQPEDKGRVEITDDEIEIEVSSSTHFKIGKFKKLIENHQLFFEHFKRGMKEADAKNYDHEETKRQASFIVYNRAWYYIKDFDLLSSMRVEKSMKSALTYLKSKSSLRIG